MHTHIHMLNANLISYQKGAYYEGIKLLSTLPVSIKDYDTIQMYLSQH